MLLVHIYHVFPAVMLTRYRVVVYHARNYIGGKMSAIKMFQFCFNTSFLDTNCSSMRFPKFVPAVSLSAYFHSLSIPLDLFLSMFFSLSQAIFYSLSLYSFLLISFSLHLYFCRSRLDGIARHESKFEGKFAVELSLSVQIDESTVECPYQVFARGMVTGEGVTISLSKLAAVRLKKGTAQ